MTMQAGSFEEEWSRRRFLAAGAVGTGALLVSGIWPGAKAGSPPPAPARAEDAAGHFQALGVDDGILVRVLAAAMARGGGFADAFFQHKTSNFVGLEDGAVNRAYSQVEIGCGIRVVKGDQTGFAFTEDLREEALLAAARTAAVVADGPARPPAQSVARISLPNLYAMEIPWHEVGMEKKIPLVEQTAAMVEEYDKRIVKVSVFLSDSTSYVLLADSRGRILEDVQPMAESWASCVAEEKGRREQNGYSLAERRGFEFFSPQCLKELAHKAARRTIVLFEATPPPAGEYPVVLAPGLSGILLHEAIGHGMEADFNRKGISVYADRIGKPIAPEFVSIVDDGTNPHMRGTINADDEGQLSRRTVLVEKGILTSYMHDRISAAHYGVETTANGRRECYRFPPVPRMRNTYMLNGPHSPEEILKSVKRGIFAETFTNGQVNIGSGDFSFYLKNGYLIEDGKLTRPVKDANLIGFGPKVLEKVEMVGDDLGFYSGAGYCGKDGQRVPVGFGLPTCRCGGMSIGGV